MASYEQQLLVRLHEAGHAVVCHGLGGKIVKVTRDKLVRAPGCPLDGAALAAVALAGALAARMYGPRHRSPNRNPSANDERTAAHALGVQRLTVQAQSQCEGIARQVLLDKRRAVLAVASALGRVPELTGAQVARLFDGDTVDQVLSAVPARIAATHVVSASPERETPKPMGALGWPEIRNEAGRPTKALVNASDLPRVALAYGLTFADLEDFNLGLPESTETEWVRLCEW